MSVHVTSWVWKSSQARGVDKLVLLKIADAANDDGGDAWPALATIATECGLDRKTVKRSIRRLIELGELTEEVNAGGPIDRRRDRRTNRYTVLRNEGAQRPPVESHEGAESPLRGGTAPPNPSMNHPIPITRDREPFAAEFAEVWEHYPRKLSRAAAFSAYRARRRAGVSREELETATINYARVREGEEIEYTLHGATFYGPRERWKDYLAEEPEADPVPDWMRREIPAQQ